MVLLDTVFDSSNIDREYSLSRCDTLDTVVELATNSVHGDAQGRELREYFCRVCPEKTQGYTIPEGWLVVRKTHNVQDGPKTIGIYSSGHCLAIDVISKELKISIQHARLLIASHVSR